MRLVEIAVPAGQRTSVLDTLDSLDIDYVVTEAEGKESYEAVISIALPVAAVETVLDDLRASGLTEDARTVVVGAETVISREYDELAEHVETEESTEDQIARQELETRARDLTPTLPIYLIMTVVSVLVATAGLLLNSPAVVVGSMVIAPLIGPALSASVGTVINDDALFRSGFSYQVVGVVGAILAAAIFAGILRITLLVPPGEEVLVIPEVAERLRPDLLSLFIALGAGVAGILSLTTGISAALVGVMIAAALIPPAAAAGVAIAWGEPILAIGATVLVLVNLISINLMGLITLWVSGYRPERFFETDHARRQLLQQLGLYGVAVAGLSSFLVASSVTAVQHSRFESEVERAIETAIAATDEPGLQLLAYSVEYDERPVFARAVGVTVELGTPAGETVADIPGRISEEIEGRTDQSVPVRVRFLAVSDSASR